jgi:hypothetical protein
MCYWELFLGSYLLLYGPDFEGGTRSPLFYPIVLACWCDWPGFENSIKGVSIVSTLSAGTYIFRHTFFFLIFPNVRSLNCWGNSCRENSSRSEKVFHVHHVQQPTFITPAALAKSLSKATSKSRLNWMTRKSHHITIVLCIFVKIEVDYIRRSYSFELIVSRVDM